jgi:uncharacterized DUF497 family protein
MPIRFEWDPAKNDANQRKHGLRFEDVQAIFLRPSTRRDNIDDTYAGHEHHFVSIGPLPSGLVSVVWTEPREGTVRIVSARCATKREHRLYREEMDQEL